jgi:hypothetical protein|tara:strand:+ start:152 stop:406 length:255 start_codon:yes stop_codon:yes gene_type:complete
MDRNPHSMMSVIEQTQREVMDYVLKNRNRKMVASISGLHINTVSDIVSGRRKGCNIETLIKLEAAVNEIKEKEAKDSWYYRGPK